MTPLQENNKDPIIDLEYKVIYKMTDREFRIITPLKKFRELQLIKIKFETNSWTKWEFDKELEIIETKQKSETKNTII